jgi:hypothetical protein
MSSSSGFTPSIRPPQHNLLQRDNTVYRSTLSNEVPYFIQVAGESSSDSITSNVDNLNNNMQREVKKAKKPASPVHNDGIFTPVVRAAKAVLGEERLNKVRAKVISTHSDVISGFVDTSDTAFGTTVLKQLFYLADKDKNGTICKQELQDALASLGFEWLQEKQIQGIFARADADGNGTICMDEWLAEAPKTLRTNLIKLAKKNGGELGFLS